MLDKLQLFFLRYQLKCLHERMDNMSLDLTNLEAKITAYVANGEKVKADLAAAQDALTKANADLAAAQAQIDALTASVPAVQQ